MALQEQIHLYSLDTSAFYDEEEMAIHKDLSEMYIEIHSLKKKIGNIDKSKKDKVKALKIETEHDTLTSYSRSLTSADIRLRKEICDLRHRIAERKAELKDILESTSIARILNPNMANDRNVVSIFASALTRTLGLKHNELTDKLVIVKTYYFEILKDITTKGFYYNGEKYRFLTASAGQIRTKKTVFIKESEWKKHEKTLTCGLSIDDINAKGGVNINKYLAYLALSNSATEEWNDFDIDKAIVVNDLETIVTSEVDYIEEKNYTITRKIMDIPIEHTDGCGLLCDQLYKKSRMVRLPFVKGLLSPFPIRKFIREAKKDPENKDIKDSVAKVKDIYGKEWDIEKDDIRVIFTKSQFKMWKYYDSWEEYKKAFKKYNCRAGECNVEPDADKFNNAKINYQMLQTLTDITDEEIVSLCAKTNQNIKNVGESKEIMLELMGATEENESKNGLQRALYMYPELLRDEHCKKTLREVKKSYVKSARAGKIEVDGKYTFIIPDLYAFCEKLFLKKDNPQGLLGNGEVYCNLYPENNKLDCLRSPHLYREHAIRKNMAHNKDKEAKKKLKRWFVTNGLYTSIHDPMSKILMFDCDGDTSLVCADKTLIEVAERNTGDVVPLYYEMSVAKVENIDTSSMYNGMIAAYTGGNIGMISNDITKIWNRDTVDDNAIKTIKLLCMENNFVIDFAKTLYKPTRPDHINSMMREYTKGKVPHFFMYAKDKEFDNVEDKNNSTMNRFSRAIEDARLDFRCSKIKPIDVTMMMKTKERRGVKEETKQDIIDIYKTLNITRNLRVKRDGGSDHNRNVSHSIKELRRAMTLTKGRSKEFVVDVLVKWLYGKGNHTSKSLLWDCFGDVIANNIEANLKKRYGGLNFVYCEVCGDRFVPDSNRAKYCVQCAKSVKNEQNKKYYHLGN